MTLSVPWLITVVNFSGFLCSEHSKQSDYKLVSEYIKVTYVNPDYVEIEDWSFQKFNKTTGGFNMLFTFKQDLDDTFTDHIVGFMFRNNEFKKSVIDFDLKLCSLFEQTNNFDIGHLLQHSNLTLKCPIKKGTYYIINLVPDAHNYPPLLPAGRWLFKHELKLKGIAITNMEMIWKVIYFL